MVLNVKEDVISFCLCGDNVDTYMEQVVKESQLADPCSPPCGY